MVIKNLTTVLLWTALMLFAFSLAAAALGWLLSLALTKLLLALGFGFLLLRHAGSPRKIFETASRKFFTRSL